MPLARCRSCTIIARVVISMECSCSDSVLLLTTTRTPGMEVNSKLLNLSLFVEDQSGRPPRPEGRGFHAPGWLRCGPCGATPFPPRPERRGSSGVLDGLCLLSRYRG